MANVGGGSLLGFSGVQVLGYDVSNLRSRLRLRSGSSLLILYGVETSEPGPKRGNQGGVAGLVRVREVLVREDYHISAKPFLPPRWTCRRYTRFGPDVVKLGSQDNFPRIVPGVGRYPEIGALSETISRKVI